MRNFKIFWSSWSKQDSKGSRTGLYSKNFFRETWTLARNTRAAATHERKTKIPWATHESFSQNCSHSWTFFRRIDARCVFFTVHSWTMKPRLLMKSFHCILVKAARIQCRLDFVFLEQLTWTDAYSINKLFKNQSLPIHCPLMNQSWATHERRASVHVSRHVTRVL